MTFLDMEWYWWLLIVVVVIIAIPFKVNNPAASCGVCDPRGIRQMSAPQPLGSLLAGIKFMKWWHKRRQEKKNNQPGKWGDDE